MFDSEGRNVILSCDTFHCRQRLAQDVPNNGKHLQRQEKEKEHEAIWMKNVWEQEK